MVNRYIFFAAIAVFLVGALYSVNFFYFFGGALSNDGANWDQFGDYFGGVLNPILSFISIFLVVRSLVLQSEANQAGERGERIRAFESLFFNMIDRQSAGFSDFSIRSKGRVLTASEAVRFIEGEIERISSNSIEEIPNAIKFYDDGDEIFKLSRMFYVSEKIVHEKLSDENGFSKKDREMYYNVLINMSDFALLRLIMISMRFLSYKSSDFLRNNSELVFVMNGLGLDYKMYGEMP
ncbi:hypothetical protein ACFONG_12245 [Uliginosibacterium paludis]|uniref:Phage abortive infection protein n=1 Tax=Uliginosibacterium paludis TaxID=1615952 RepID=A0ABV2CQU9_9RHOO